MNHYDNGGKLPPGPTEVTADEDEAILAEDAWQSTRRVSEFDWNAIGRTIGEAVTTAWDQLVEGMNELAKSLNSLIQSPFGAKYRRITRKRNARARKQDRILARQVARATRYPDQAPPLLHKGKMHR